MHKILIVEDDPKITAALEVRFRIAGYSTSVAYDAVHATRLAISGLPDLILLDISLPAGNGLQLANKFRTMDVTSKIPVVFLTASDDPDLREKATGLHAAGLVAKPYEIAELLAVVEHCLRPASSAARHNGQSPSLDTATRKRCKRILVVEDDPKIAMALGLRLKAAGCQIELAFDALLGVQAAMQHSPDLVLLDISMPAGNGFTVAEKIRKFIDPPPHLIFLTASKQPTFRRRAEELGAAAYFEKPYEAEELIIAIEKIFRGESALPALTA